MGKPNIVNNPEALQKFIAMHNLEETNRMKIPKWKKDPYLIPKIIETVSECGRFDFSAGLHDVSPDLLNRWLEQGKEEVKFCDDNDFHEYPPMATFYLGMHHARSYFFYNKLKEMEKAVNDEKTGRFHTQYRTWIMENIDAEKRFSPRQYIDQKVEEKKEVTINVRIAGGNEWITGMKQETIEGDVVDTKMLPPGDE